MANQPVGARSYGGKRNHGLAWVPWLALLLLALLALAIFALLRNIGDTDDASGIDLTNEVASSTGANANNAGSNAGAGAGMSSPATNMAGPLVGGVGVAASAATSSPAAADGTLVQGTVLFAEDSAALNATSNQVIAQAARLIQQKSATAVTVSGYTDVVGGAPVNDGLSQRRADAVAQQLRSLLGAGVQVTPVSRGESDPVAPNANADGTDNPTNRQQNRRAVIAIAP